MSNSRLDLPVAGRDSNSGTGTFLIGLLCGTAIGAALGLLLAPKSGAALRRQIADTSDSLRRRATDAYGDATDMATSAVDRGRTVVNDLVDRGRRAVNDAAEYGREVVDQGADAVERGKNAYRSTMAEKSPAARRPNGSSS